MKIPLLRGRDFQADDRANGAPVAIVNEIVAKTYFNNNALGSLVYLPIPSNPPIKIIGVVRDSKYGSLGEEPMPAIYLPVSQAPRLLAAFGADRERYRSAEEMQCFSGIAPVTKRSGKTTFVQRRLACPNFVRQSFHEFAKSSICRSSWARAIVKHICRKGTILTFSRHQALSRYGGGFLR
jgi:MacB-like protein/transposase IS116/IS110/IS902 family protein